MKTFSPSESEVEKPNYNGFSEKYKKTHVIENCPILYYNLEIQGLFQRLHGFVGFFRNDLTGIVGHKL